MTPQVSKGSFARTNTVPQTNEMPSLSDEQKKVDELISANKDLNVNTITDEIFYQRHKDLRGTSLPKEGQLTDEWKQIKKDIVEPRIAASHNQAETTEVQQPPSPGASAEATDRRSFMAIGADFLKNTLNKTVGWNQPKEDPLGECLQEDKTSLSRAQELAKVDTTKLTTEAQKYDHYKELIEAGGGQINEAPGARNLVSIRHPSPVDSGRIDSATKNSMGTYDDTMVVIYKDNDGGKHVKEIIDRANTDPNRFWVEVDSPDLNNDGFGDAGRVAAGFHKYKLSERTVKKQTEECLRPVDSVKIERDLNGDGIFLNDMDEVELRDGGDSFLIHNGKGKKDTGSAGCQTIAVDKWPEFMNAVKTDHLPITNGENIGYTLVQLDE